MKKLKIGKSKIHGKGLFSGEPIKKGELIAKVHSGIQMDPETVKYMPTQYGRFYNHDEKGFNTRNEIIGNHRYLRAIKAIPANTELTANYREHPEMEQPEDFGTGKYASFDFDKTIATDEGLEKARQMLKDGYNLFIISARDKVTPDMVARARKAGIPEENIIATGSDEAKVRKVKQLGVEMHFDDKPEVISELGLVGRQFKKGGGVNSKKYTRSIFGKNKLFVKNKLFKTKKVKNRIYDPNAKYFDNGGTVTEGEPLTENQLALQNFVYPNSQAECDDDGRCYETDQIQEMLDRGRSIPGDVLDVAWDVIYEVNPEEGPGISAATAWKNRGVQTLAKRLGMSNPANCMWAAGSGWQCMPEFENVPKTAFESNDKFISAVNKGTVPFTRVTKTSDPSFDSKEKGILKEGDIINVKGPNTSHAMTFSHYREDGTPIYVDSNGNAVDFDFNVGMWSGMKPGNGRTAYVSRFSPDMLYGDKIRELEEKARTNPTYYTTDDQTMIPTGYRMGGFPTDISIPELNQFDNGGIITYKNNASLIDGTANFDMISKVPISQEYNAQIKHRLYTGNYGFNTETGELFVLPKSKQTTIPDEIKTIRAQEEDTNAYNESVRLAGGVDPKMMNPDVQETKDMTDTELKDFINQGYYAAMFNPVFKTAAMFTPVGAALGTIEGVANLAPDLYQGNYADAAFDLAGALPVAKGIGKFLTTQTPLKNTYKINPLRFKADPNAAYRMIGDEAGFQDALTTGVLRPNPQGKYSATFYNVGTPLERYGSMQASGTGRQYIAEVPLGNEKLLERFPGDKYRVSKADQHVSINDPNVTLYTQDWLKGYKPVNNSGQNIGFGNIIRAGSAGAESELAPEEKNGGFIRKLKRKNNGGPTTNIPENNIKESSCQEGYKWDEETQQCVPLIDEDWLVNWYANRKLPLDQISNKKYVNIMKERLPQYNPESTLLEELGNTPPVEYQDIIANTPDVQGEVTYDKNWNPDKILLKRSLLNDPVKLNQVYNHERSTAVDVDEPGLFDAQNAVIDPGLVLFKDRWGDLEGDARNYAEDNYNYLTDPAQDNIHSLIFEERYKRGIKPDQVLTEEDINNWRTEAEASGALDRNSPNFDDTLYTLFKLAKDNKALMDWFNKLASNDTPQDKNAPQYAKKGGSIGYELGDQVDESTMRKLKKLGYTFQKI